jgi:hypothetical protein
MMSSDRVGRNTFPLSHECLGVRRASVSKAAEPLQSAGIIDYHRGSVTIVDPRRLEAAACEDYRLSRAAYDQAYEVTAPADDQSPIHSLGRGRTSPSGGGFRPKRMWGEFSHVDAAR